MGKRKHKARQKFLDSLSEEEKLERGMWGYVPTNSGKKILCRGSVHGDMLFIPLRTKEEPVDFWSFVKDGKLMGDW
jgi:hypothetical protein|nr:MAG TPA: hypothetical protein [Caudoviricetes sp.]